MVWVEGTNAFLLLSLPPSFPPPLPPSLSPSLLLVPVVGVSGVVVELSGQCLPFQITWVGVALQDIRGPAHLANYSVMYEGGGEVGEVTVPYYQEPMVSRDTHPSLS